jgi:hypothetical protein
MTLEIGVKCLNQLGVCSSNTDPSSKTICCHSLTSAQTLNIRAMEQKAPLFISNVSSSVEGAYFHTARTGHPVETSHQ